jgi:hypothetical protein
MTDVNIDKITLKLTVYINIKLDSLRDVLRIVLKYIKWIGLRKNKSFIYIFVYNQRKYSRVNKSIKLNETYYIIIFLN